MNRRNMLKVLPLAALAGVSVKVGTTEAKAFEMKPNKKYIFVMPDVPAAHAQQCSNVLRERGIDATICATDAEISIYELL